MAHLGIYRGNVTNTADPMMKGRVQVVVPAVAAATLGWAEPCRESRSTALPPVGTVVWVMFERGDASYPVWMGCLA